MQTPPHIKAKRPLSPHLQVYKPQMTSVSSILNRITGAGLAVGLIVFTWWLVAASIGPDAYALFTEFAGSSLGLVLFVGWTAAFYYHMVNGIRHLIWDFGVGINMKNAYNTGFLVFVLTAVLTGGTWFCIVTMGGVF